MSNEPPRWRAVSSLVQQSGSQVGGAWFSLDLHVAKSVTLRSEIGGWLVGNRNYRVSLCFKQI